MWREKARTGSFIKIQCKIFNFQPYNDDLNRSTSGWQMRIHIYAFAFEQVFIHKIGCVACRIYEVRHLSVPSVSSRSIYALQFYNWCECLTRKLRSNCSNWIKWSFSQFDCDSLLYWETHLLSSFCSYSLSLNHSICANIEFLRSTTNEKKHIDLHLINICWKSANELSGREKK